MASLVCVICMVVHIASHLQLPTDLCIAAGDPFMCAVDYGFVLSPNQTPYRDMYFLEKLLGIGANDGVAVNTVFTRLCWLMGVWPAVYASLLLPSAKSGNKVQAAAS